MLTIAHIYVSKEDEIQRSINNIRPLWLLAFELKEQCHPEVSWLLVPQELPKFPSGGEGATVLSVTLYPNYHHHHLSHHHPPPGPCCMCELLGWFNSGGLVIKQVTISPTGVRCFTSLQEACNLSLITHLTINRQTVRHPPYGVMLWSPQTSKHYPHRAME